MATRPTSTCCRHAVPAPRLSRPIRREPKGRRGRRAVRSPSPCLQDWIPAAAKVRVTLQHPTAPYPTAPCTTAPCTTAPCATAPCATAPYSSRHPTLRLGPGLGLGLTLTLQHPAAPCATAPYSTLQHPALRLGPGLGLELGLGLSVTSETPVDLVLPYSAHLKHKELKQ